MSPEGSKAPKLPGEKGFLFDRFAKSREPKPPPESDIPPEVKEGLDALGPPPGAEGSEAPMPEMGGMGKMGGMGEMGGAEGAPPPSGDTAPLVEKLGIDEAKAQSFLDAAQRIPEVADLDASALADKIDGDFRLRMKLERISGETENDLGGMSPKPPPKAPAKDDESEDEDEDAPLKGEEE